MLTTDDIGLVHEVEAKVTSPGGDGWNCNEYCLATLGFAKLCVLPVSMSAHSLCPLHSIIAANFRRDFGNRSYSQVSVGY